MPKEQRTFTQEFKREAVQLVQRSGKSQVQVARELGIADSTLHHWCKQFADQGQQAFVGSGPPMCGRRKAGSMWRWCWICFRDGRVGWAMSQHNDEHLVRQALEMAVARRVPPTEMLLHSEEAQSVYQYGLAASFERAGDRGEHVAGWQLFR